MHKIMLLALAGTATANAAAMAAPPGSVTISPDGLTVIVARAPNIPFTRAHRATGTTIFDNFASLDPKGVYAAGFGSGFGYNSSTYPSVELAAAFIASASATVTEIDIAAGYISGIQTAVQVHLYQDAGGVPGAEIWTHATQLPPDEGSCCGITALTLQTGQVKVIAGQQYWLSLSATKGGPNIYAAWYINVADQVDIGQTAINLSGAGWTASQQLPQVAFGIYGK